MRSRLSSLVSALSLAAVATTTLAVDQTVVGAGNADADKLATSAPRVQNAHRFLVENARQIKNPALRQVTLDLLRNRDFCVTTRAGVNDSTKHQMIAALSAAGLINPADDSTFPGGLLAGVFPPVLNADSACPHLPMAFDTAPGSSFTSHHGYPGGLPIHEANNLRAGLGLLAGYQGSYQTPNGNDQRQDSSTHHDDDEAEGWMKSPLFIDRDVIVAAPIWHDWAKTMVFQWTAEGKEFSELNFGGTPANGSATGGHHIISIAESMKRGLPPVFVIAQASAHSNPTLGNEFKVVNWLRAAGILAQVDPVAAGYLMQDAGGNYRLPALRKLADGFDLVNAGQTNLLPEYTIHNLSDGDFTFSIPAAGDASLLIAQLAPRFGFDPFDVATYNTKYRNPIFANVSQERLLILYGNGGISAVQSELDILRARQVF